MDQFAREVQDELGGDVGLRRRRVRQVGGCKRLENQRIAREGVIGRTEGHEDRIRRRRLDGFGWLRH